MNKLNNVKIFINTYKDFNYEIPYEATIVSRYKLNNLYDVPVIYADRLNDELLDNFRDCLCDMYSILYVSKMQYLPDTIGFVQYRRYFADVLDVPSQYTFTKNYHTKIDIQFKNCHSSNEWNILEEFINSSKYKIGYEYALEHNDARFHSMFILPKENFLELSEIINSFAHFFINRHNFKTDEDFKNKFTDKYKQRIMGSHLLERLISIYSSYLITNGIQLNENEIIERTY